MWVFKANSKAERLEIDCNLVGKEFHKSTTDIQKDLSLTVLRGEERWQDRRFLELLLVTRTLSGMKNWSWKYIGVLETL